MSEEPKAAVTEPRELDRTERLIVGYVTMYPGVSKGHVCRFLDIPRYQVDRCVQRGLLDAPRTDAIGKPCALRVSRWGRLMAKRARMIVTS